MIKVVKIDCETRTLTEVEIPATLEGYYKVIECRIMEGTPIELDEYSYAETVNEIYVDEEFMYTPKPGGFHMDGSQWMLGNGMIVGVELEEGDFVDHHVDIEKIRQVIHFVSAEDAAGLQAGF